MNPSNPLTARQERLQRLGLPIDMPISKINVLPAEKIQAAQEKRLAGQERRLQAQLEEIKARAAENAHTNPLQDHSDAHKLTPVQPVQVLELHQIDSAQSSSLPDSDALPKAKLEPELKRVHAGLPFLTAALAFVVVVQSLLIVLLLL